MSFFPEQPEQMSKRLGLLLERVAGVSVAQPDWQGKLANWIAQHPNRCGKGVGLLAKLKATRAELNPQPYSPVQDEQQ
ncbi:hypothetical protein MNBD_ALPHA06-1012, partial [hydrothermal vent metagenome]